MLKNHCYKYNDRIFKLRHKFLKNIPEFSQLSYKSIRSIWLKMEREDVIRNKIIIRFGEVNKNCYFVEKGEIVVYVWNELTKSAYHFQRILPGGWFNFVSSLIGHSSLFIIRSVKRSTLLKLDYEDLKELSKTDKDINHIIQRTQSKYMYSQK